LRGSDVIGWGGLAAPSCGGGGAIIDDRIRRMKLPLKRTVLYAVFLLAFVELVLRFAFPLPELENFGRVNYMPLALGFSRRDVAQVRNVNLVVESGPDDLRFVHRLNAYGFRDREWTTANRAGLPRIFFVGDSFVEGEMARAEETIPAAYAALALADGKLYDVMNLGVMAADFESYLTLIQDAAPIFRPDDVFLFLYANDLAKPVTVARSDFRPEYFRRHVPRLVELAAAISRDEMPTLRWNYVELAFFKPVPDRLNPWTGRDDLTQYVTPEMAAHIREGRFNPYAVGDLAALEEALRKPAQAGPPLRFLRDFLAEHGARLHVAYLPSRHQVTTRYVEYARTYCLTCPPDTNLTGPQYRLHAAQLARACEELGLPFLDLTPLIEEEEARGTPLYWDYDDHMRGRGYRFVGEAVYDRWQP
jgi:lysophospholipase L1-like esterase